MSASLVGSEMCIRDRYCCPCPALRQPSRGVGLRVPNWCWPTRLPGCKTCLLYTSDAADDM
eukprot:13675954-Alexandrium_andersonii.AAC.1